MVEKVGTSFELDYLVDFEGEGFFEMELLDHGEEMLGGDLLAELEFTAETSDYEVD